MTSREALEELKNVLETNPGTRKYVDIFEKNLIGPIEKDINLVESLKSVLLKVVCTYYQPIITSKENENGSIECYLNNGVRIDKGFDVVMFKEIIDHLGFKLVAKDE